MARAVTTCVHCGFCLAACPTYRVLGEEMDSPRGRIVLMKQALEGQLAISEALPFIDRCLACLACETACPSGVKYRELVIPFRAHAESKSRGAAVRMSRAALLRIFESPTRFRAVYAVGRIARSFSWLLPHSFRSMLDLLPARLPMIEALPEFTPAVGRRRARVALLAGCVQQALRPSINKATLRVLAANGVETVVPRTQGCCGALALHAGHDDHANVLAERNERAFPKDVDAILTTAAGCGSAMKERGYAVPVKDISEFLDTLGITTGLALERPTTIAYQDACHLSHGQGIRDAPRRLLMRIANATLVNAPDNDMCCGSAGLYNLEHPQTAGELGRRKATAVIATGADVVVSGNIGCLTQMEMHLASFASRIPARHTMEMLDLAYSPPVHGLQSTVHSRCEAGDRTP